MDMVNWVGGEAVGDVMKHDISSQTTTKNMVITGPSQEYFFKMIHYILCCSVEDTATCWVARSFLKAAMRFRFITGSYFLTERIRKIFMAETYFIANVIF